jgi:hypothetical protein
VITNKHLNNGQFLVQRSVRDTTDKEDHNQVRTGHAPRTIAALTNAVLTALRAAKLQEIRPTTRALHAQNKLIQAVLAVV